MNDPEEHGSRAPGKPGSNEQKTSYRKETPETMITIYNNPGFQPNERWLQNNPDLRDIRTRMIEAGDIPPSRYSKREMAIWERLGGTAAN